MSMDTKLCCCFNSPSLYRELIYKKIEERYDCDWYFEDTNSNLKEFDTNQLKNVKRLHTYSLGVFYGVKGLISLLWKKEYSHFLMMGHSRNISTFFFVILKCLFFPYKKIYLWTHGFYGKESFLEEIWKKLLFKSVDELFIYGDYSCRIMSERYGFMQEKLHAIHNSLDYDVQLKLRSELSLSSIYKEHFGNSNSTIIFIGRLTPVKKLDMLVQAIYDLKILGKYYNLTFVGEGDEYASLQEKAQNLGINNQIWFYGACYDEKQNAELVYNADLCVAPGNIGLTSIHVLMFGCPAISHNEFPYQMPEFEVINDGVTGTFFERDNQESLNASISRWFSQESYNREKIRMNCYEEIDSKWNPYYQMDVIKQVIK